MGNVINKFFAWIGMVAVMFSAPALAEENRISKSDLSEMFANIETNTTWNLDGDLLWGYFFTSTDRTHLGKLGSYLREQGYKMVEVRRIEPDNRNEPSQWQLHVERIEHHSPDSLYDRNQVLYKIADSYPGVVYDGMDVGPAN